MTVHHGPKLPAAITGFAAPRLASPSAGEVLPIRAGKRQHLPLPSRKMARNVDAFSANRISRDLLNTGCIRRATKHEEPWDGRTGRANPPDMRPGECYPSRLYHTEKRVSSIFRGSERDQKQSKSGPQRWHLIAGVIEYAFIQQNKPLREPRVPSGTRANPTKRRAFPGNLTH